MRGSALCAFLVLAFSVAAETLTVTVTSYNSATVTGDEAEEVAVSYLQHQTTHSKSRLTAGDTAVLVLNNLPDGVITSMTLSMKSNKTAGAGWLNMRVGNAVCWQIPDSKFSSDNWYGAFSTEYVAIAHPFSPGVTMGALLLEIGATENSLYLESLTITYERPIPVPHTVQFCTNTTAAVAPLTEASVGSGVVLPELADPAGCFFYGWTEAQVEGQAERPVYFPGGSTYFPKRDVQLYALYGTQSPRLARVLQDTLCQSGEYALVMLNMGTPRMLKGAVRGKVIESEEVALSEENALYILKTDYLPDTYRYQLDFVGDSLRITHVATQLPIGYVETSTGYSLGADDVAWEWHKAQHQTLFVSHHWDEVSNRCYLLCTNSTGATLDERVETVYVQRKYNWEYLALFPVANLPAELPDRWYSSMPITNAVEHVGLQDIDWTQPVAVYSLTGCLYAEGALQQAALPRGIWLIRQGTKAMKIALFQ